MDEPLLIPLAQVANLTDEAILVVDASTHKVVFASASALETMNASSGSIQSAAVFDLLDPDDGRLKRFLDNASTVSSPLIARVRCLSDGELLTAKGHRVTSPSGEAWIIVCLKVDTELSRRFRLLADKINALNLEIERRKKFEAQLSRNASALERMLVAVRQMSEIDTSDPAYLNYALDALRTACASPGVVTIGSEAGRLVVLGASGDLADALDKGVPLEKCAGSEKFLQMTEGALVEYLSVALDKAARSACDLSDLSVLPLYVGNLPKSFLVLRGVGDDRNEAEILAEALASLMIRAGAEADLRHSQKLHAVGQLTGGIAHDFNNILAVILGNAELVMDQSPSVGPESIEAELANEIRDAALRGATLTSRLLSFARKQPLKPKSLCLNAVLRDLDILIRRAIGGSVKIELVGGGGLWKTRLDQSQLENALLNLAVNARDAMHGGGRLTIETANTCLDAEYAAQHLEVTQGQYVMVAVTDTGTGMSRDVIHEAFTPFFTTKPIGKGSGLGLSMVFGFVKQSGGHVKIYSEVGYGTTIKMYFPRDLSNLGTNLGQQVPVRDRLKSADGHVLLVEDDLAILRYAERTLKMLGYSVDTAVSGDDAAELMRSESYDILLTDVVLPGQLNGARLAELAYEVSPRIKVLFMSGFTENAIVHNGQLDPNVELISKPFTRDQLAHRLHSLKKT